jgi:hypothetical protein
MATLFEEKFYRDGINYRVSLSFDDGAIMNGSAKFDTIVSRQKEGDEKWNEVSVTSELNWPEKKIILTAKADSLAIQFRHEIDLTAFLPDAGDAIEKFSDEYLDGLLDGKLVDGVEKLIHLVPTDPLLGCLIKGSLSTLIGQIIRCWPRIRDESKNRREWKAKILNMCGMLAKCLQTNSLKMLGTFTRRFLKCALFHGLA